MSWFFRPVFVGAGLAAITGTGALLAQTSDITGAGVSGSVGTGSLLAQSGDITGAGTAGAATITGTGALIAGAATLDGTGTVLAVITGIGALLAQAASVDGSGSVGVVVIAQPDSHDGGYTREYAKSWRRDESVREALLEHFEGPKLTPERSRITTEARAQLAQLLAMPPDLAAMIQQAQELSRQLERLKQQQLAEVQDEEDAAEILTFL